MSEKRIGIIMHGVTGRMGMNQHLIRSILEIRKQGGVALKDGTRLMPDPILVGRNAAKVEELAKKQGVERWTAETSAPVYMRRFGWTPDMVKPGDHIIIDGYAARDGSHLMRIQTLKRPDGTQIGGRLQAGDQ